MGDRTSARRSIPGSPMEGLLRNTMREARSTSRGQAGPTGATGPEGPRGPAGAGIGRAATLTCDASGVAVWTFGAALPYVPVVSATPTAAPGVAAIATVSGVSATGATVQVMQWNGTAWAGASGATVHVVAVQGL
jgi:hypothetical protein